MISITSQTADSDGAVLFQERPESEFFNSNARVSRSATLDGLGVLDNQGFSDSDRTFRIRADLTEDQRNALWALYKAHTDFYISCIDGFYPGAIGQIEVNRNPVFFTFLVEGV